MRGAALHTELVSFVLGIPYQTLGAMLGDVGSVLRGDVRRWAEIGEEVAWRCATLGTGFDGQ